MISRNSHPRKREIVAEYLSTEVTLAALGEKYGIPLRTIQTWVRAERKRRGDLPLAVEGNQSSKDLVRELEREKLKNELLEELLRLSKEETGVDLKKKYGTKRS